MATLTKTAVVARKVIRYGLYALFLIIVARYTLIVGGKLYRRFFPEPPPPPTGIAKLPAIPFPNVQIPNYEKLVFVLETPDGKLPNLPPQAKVYFLTKRTSNIKTLERANQKARSLGYDPNGKEITETSYQYQHPNLPCTLEMNIVTELFSMSCDLRDEKLSISNVVLTPDAAIKQVKAFLSRAQLLPADMSGPAVHEFIKMSEGKLVGAISLSESEMIKVNLYRKDLETIPSVASRSDQSNLWFILSPLNTYGNVVIAGEYHYFPLDETRFDTYALKTASEAWEDLKTGKGYIANLGQNNEGVLKIRRIYLAYYDPDVYTQYYQPVVVFEGDNNFVAYVPVITSLYYGSDQLTPTEEP